MSAVPKLRFPSNPIHNFPDWAPLNLYEVASFFSGGTPKSTDQAYYGGQIPFIKSGEIKSITTSQTLSELGLKSSSAKKVSRGDLLYALYGATSGEVAISKIDGAINQAVLCIRTQLDTYFLYSWLLREKQNILDTYLQGGQGNLSAQIVKNFKIFAPSLPEQQKIASFLSSVDKKIDLLRQKKDAFELYKTGLMQKIFSQKIRFKQDDGSDFPDWEEVALNEIAKRSTEKNKDLELTLVLTNSATQGVMIQTEYFDKSIANEANISGYYKVRKSDFVYNPRISSAAPVGPISQNLKADGIMSPLYTVFRVDDQYQKFVSMYCKSSVWFNYMRSVANQGARYDRMNITTSDFMALPIDLPCAKERQKIAKFLSVIDAKIHNASSQIEQMETFKKGLLQQMFV